MGAYFAHKIRAYAYLIRLGRAGVAPTEGEGLGCPPATSSNACAARYPAPCRATPASRAATCTSSSSRQDEDFHAFEAAGVQRSSIMAGHGQGFLTWLPRADHE
jgi:hypothetical protein